MTNEKGFSLIELLIVVVVIGIIAATAIPNLLSSRRAANEASALRSLRAIASAQVVYYSTRGNANYGTAAQLYSSDLIDGMVAAACGVNVGGNPPTNTAKAGYRFRIQTTAANPTSGLPSTHVASAVPSTTTGTTQTGAGRLCLTESGLMKRSTASIGTHFNYTQCNSAAAFGQ